MCRRTHHLSEVRPKANWRFGGLPRADPASQGRPTGGEGGVQPSPLTARKKGDVIAGGPPLQGAVGTLQGLRARPRYGPDGEAECVQHEEYACDPSRLERTSHHETHRSDALRRFGVSASLARFAGRCRESVPTQSDNLLRHACAYQTPS